VLILTLAMPTAAPLTVAPESRLWVEGDSTMHKWSCQATTLEISAEALPGLPGELPTVTSLRVVVPVASLQSGQDGLDEKLREALQAKQHPRIEYAMASLRPRPGDAGGTRQLELAGALTVAGRTRDAPVSITATLLPDGSIAVNGMAPLRMSDFGVKPPTAMFGLIKAADAVTVKFELRVRAAASAGQR
jgi:polyisoprenoid-binding protein YceI